METSRLVDRLAKDFSKRGGPENIEGMMHDLSSDFHPQKKSLFLKSKGKMRNRSNEKIEKWTESSIQEKNEDLKKARTAKSNSARKTLERS